MLHLDDILFLRCPISRGPLLFRGEVIGNRIWSGELTTNTGRGWYVRKGIPALFDPSAVGPLDRAFQKLYDVIAPFHDISVTYLLPLLQLSNEKQLRQSYMDRLNLSSKFNGLRILEIGVGSGANIPFLSEYLSPYAQVEIWGLDLSLRMLKRAEYRVAAGEGGRRVRFIQADAHQLPFPDQSFDRVFHIGAVNSFSNAKTALAEMSRVAKPNTPIVVVDEQLDTQQEKNLYLRAGFRFITWYDSNPRAPVDLLPQSAQNIELHQINNFFYCLTWTMP